MNTSTGASDGAAAATDVAAVDPGAAQRAATRRKWLTIIVVIVLVLAVFGIARAVFVSARYVSTDNAYVRGDVVEVSSQIPGTVTRILVDDTAAVQAGQLLVQLDSADQRVLRERAEAELAQAVRDVAASFASNKALQAQAAGSREQVAIVKSQLARAEADVARRQDVQAEGGVSAEELAHAKQEVHSLQAQLTAARNGARAAAEQYRASLTQVSGTSVAAHPRVQAAAAALRQAIIAEGRTQILAPVSGQVAQRSVMPGARIAPGAPLLSVVPLDRVWVEANYKEAQLRKVRAGQPVSLTSDLYGSSVHYRGRVAGVGAGTGAAFSLLPAQNATGNWIKIVQRVPVRIELDAATLREHPLRVGLSMEAEIDTSAQAAAGSASSAAAPTAAPAGVAAPRGDGVYDTLLQRADAGVERVISATLQSTAGRAPSDRPNAGS